MRTSTGRYVGIAGALAGLVTVALSAPAHGVPYFPGSSGVVAPSGAVVSNISAAGILTGWGTAGTLSLPESLDGVPVSSISMGDGWALASTLTGKVVTWGADSAIAPALPDRVDIPTMKQLAAAGTSAAAALTWDGHVTTWLGSDASAASAWLDGNSLTGIAAIAVGQQQPYGVAITKGGTVKTWGVDAGSGNVISPVPGTLTDVVDIAACDDTALALTADGGVHGWGSDIDGLVSNAPAPSANKVIQIACAGHTAIARRADSTITEWGDTSGVNAVPASLINAMASGAPVVTIDASSGGIVAQDTTGDIWAWGGPTLAGTAVPSQLTHAAKISEFAPGNDGVYALRPAVFALGKPVISGTAVPGHVLSAPFTQFSGNPADLSKQWYRDGVPIDGSSVPALDTTAVYRVTASDVGKRLTFRQTEVDTDNPAAAPVVAESDPITVGRASSTLTVTPHPGSYGRASSVTVRVASPVGASGPVSLSLDGVSAGTKTLAHGSATFKLPAMLAAGNHMLGATFQGNSVTGGATGWAMLTIAKATSHTKVTLPKKAHKGGKVKVIVKVHTSGGRATGTVVVKIGKATGYGSVVHGKAVVRLKVARTPHKQKVVANYSGDNNVRGSRAHARLTVR